MNILLLTTHLNVGGIPRYVINLAKFLKKKRENVFVGSRGGFWEDALNREGIRLLRLPLYTKSIFSPKILASFLILNNFFKTQNIDIIQANTRVSQFLAFLIYKKKRIPYISTFHGCYKPHIFRELFKCEGLKTIAVSKYVRNHLIEKLKIKPSKIELIYNGIEDTQENLSFSREELRERIKGFPLLGTVSRLSPEKNIHTLIKMIPYILEEFPQAKLIILGEGREEKNLKNLARDLGIGENVIFLKKIPPQAVFNILDIFISLSEAEPFGFSVIEAQRQGVVTIVSNKGAFGEIVEDKVSGLILKEEIPQALREAISLVLENPGFRETLIRNAQRKIREVFNAELMGEKTFNLFKRVLNSYEEV